MTISFKNRVSRGVRLIGKPNNAYEVEISIHWTYAKIVVLTFKQEYIGSNEYFDSYKDLERVYPDSNLKEFQYKIEDQIRIAKLEKENRELKKELTAYKI